MKKITFFQTLLFLLFVAYSTSSVAQTVKTVVRGSANSVSVSGTYSSIQWQTSSDNKAWYSIPNATNSEYAFKAVSQVFLRAELVDESKNKTYSEVHQIVFETKTTLKTIKSSGGQAYAETFEGQPTSGINIQEDRGSDGKLKLTAISDNWTNMSSTLNWYLYHTLGQYDIDIILNIPNNTVQQFEFEVVDINNTGMSTDKSILSVTGKGKNDTLTILNVTIPKTGFYKYRMKALKQPSTSTKIVGFRFKSLTSTTADVHATNYLSSPSVHLSSWRSTDGSVKAGQKYDWCYMEILVPPGGDALSTYYMSLGVLQGYMGIQTNSASERGVIFSMWDDGDTDKDPTLDQYKRAGAVDADPATTVSRFGNEGTGTKSFVFGNNWKTNVPVKFLTNSRLEEYDDTLKNKMGSDSIVHRRNTLVSAWFHSDNAKGWRYISTLRLPNKVSYFDSWYSFLENYGYQNGQVKRDAYYYNAFAHEQSSNPLSPGRWISFNQVNFGNTDGATGQRVDFEQGKSPNSEIPNYFYMSTGGYANAKKQYASQIPLQTDKSVVESLDLNKFLERVDLAVAKEKAKNDSIKNITNNLVSKKGWTIESFSSQETTGEGTTNGRASTIIDDNKATFWHSAWQSGTASFPHYIAVNMNSTENVTGFLFQLSGGTSRHMKGIELWGSTDGTNYVLMESLNVPDLEQFYIPLSKTWAISKFKLVIKNSQSGVVHCRINEIDVTVSKTTSGINSIFNRDNTENRVNVFPNPTRDIINFSVDKAVTNTTVSIVSMNGKEIMNNKLGNLQAYQINKLDATTLANGFYILQISDNKNFIGTQTVCIQK